MERIASTAALSLTLSKYLEAELSNSQSEIPVMIICGKEAKKKSPCSLHFMVSVDWACIGSIEFASKDAAVVCHGVEHSVDMKSRYLTFPFLSVVHEWNKPTGPHSIISQIGQLFLAPIKNRKTHKSLSIVDRGLKSVSNRYLLHLAKLYLSE